MYNAILCRYHEIAIKGHNRNMFERCLIDNMRFLFKKEQKNFLVKKVRGRIWVETKNGEAFLEDDLKIACDCLSRTCGIESFSPAIKLDANMDLIKQKVAEITPALFERFFVNFPVVTFRIRARRSNKEFALTSQEIEIALADVVSTIVNPDKLQVNLDEAQVTIGCEIRDEFAILYFEQFAAPGGLPVGSNGSCLALLSGGIDSPVACYMAMKRGCPVEFLSFHSTPYTPETTKEKIIGIADYLNKYQKGGRVFLVNFVEFQKLVRDNCTPKYRTILYRRAMLKIGAKIAYKHHRMALLTGDSIGQVASQTIENMRTIDSAVDMLILRPLVGMDKNETIKIAQKIGTFDLSNVQVPDSCTVFAPSEVATSSKIERIIEEEEKIQNYDEVLNKAVETAEIIKKW